MTTETEQRQVYEEAAALDARAAQRRANLSVGASVLFALGGVVATGVDDPLVREITLRAAGALTIASVVMRAVFNRQARQTSNVNYTPSDLALEEAVRKRYFAAQNRDAALEDGAAPEL